MAENENMQGDPTTWSAGLVAFYVSCTVVGVGAALAAVVLVVFPSEPMTPVASGIGIAMVLGGSVGAMVGLKSARHER